VASPPSHVPLHTSACLVMACSLPMPAAVLSTALQVSIEAARYTSDLAHHASLPAHSTASAETWSRHGARELQRPHTVSSCGSQHACGHPCAALRHLLLWARGAAGMGKYGPMAPVCLLCPDACGNRLAWEPRQPGPAPVGRAGAHGDGGDRCSSISTGLQAVSQDLQQAVHISAKHDRRYK
jgi:hypothetical protein